MGATLPCSPTALRFGVHKAYGQSLLVGSMSVAWRAGRAIALWPFDAMRAQYAGAVKAGIIQNSMLASRDFEHALGALERVTLGPLARRV